MRRSLAREEKAGTVSCARAFVDAIESRAVVSGCAHSERARSQEAHQHRDRDRVSKHRFDRVRGDTVRRQKKASARPVRATEAEGEWGAAGRKACMALRHGGGGVMADWLTVRLERCIICRVRTGVVGDGGECGRGAGERLGWGAPVRARRGRC
jgi:hypothetical protein